MRRGAGWRKEGCGSVGAARRPTLRASRLTPPPPLPHQVPAWVTRKWLASLSAEYPTLAFHASVTTPFGKGSLLGLLRQLARLRSDKKHVSVGFVGYPNVGKSSVINALRTKKVCTVAPVPGETKVWQYVTLTKRVFLIDCPGVVYNRAADSDTDAVLKGVVRVESLTDAPDHIPAVLARVKRSAMVRAYGVDDWADAEAFLEALARRAGKLGRGGEPDVNTAAKMVLLDWQRGKIPFYAEPPKGDGECDDGARDERAPVGAAGSKAGRRAAALAATTTPVTPANAVTEADASTEAGAAPAAAAAAAAALTRGVAAATARTLAGDEVLPQAACVRDEEGSEGEGESSSDEDGDGDGNAAAPAPAADDGDDSDGYGDGGLSWEAVLASVRQGGGGAANEDAPPAPAPAPARKRGRRGAK